MMAWWWALITGLSSGAFRDLIITLPQPPNLKLFFQDLCILVPTARFLRSAISISARYYHLFTATTVAPFTITLLATWPAQDKSNHVCCAERALFKDALMIFYFGFAFDAIPGIVIVGFDYS